MRNSERRHNVIHPRMNRAYDVCICHKPTPRQCLSRKNRHMCAGLYSVAYVFLCTASYFPMVRRARYPYSARAGHLECIRLLQPIGHITARSNTASSFGHTRTDQGQGCHMEQGALRTLPRAHLGAPSAGVAGQERRGQSQQVDISSSY